MMTNNDEIGKIMQQVFSSDKMYFRIGELSEMAGVSSRQLRYWEKQGYIESVQREGKQQARVFHFSQYGRVTGIKYYLDAGYTLQAAVGKIDESSNISTYVHKFVHNAIRAIEISEKGVNVDLGWFDEPKQIRLIAVLEDEKFVYQLKQE
ncbi:MerR family transcriptional regulator [Periweissella cryptocerci]|uniref:MerR family transcriptional regulator n=1 Tax=Periweissella cryptocerci TaxID=2506420 RepID=A0A4P6YSP7_9LACO|nr:MerR family transcriptional regulator [Periweissella cryptocerci]QBO35680.1 MerR family transcriptional regulator [Periweissella cryptocerci]